jgi:phosphoribosylaminoimidazole (AIR) synthetase
VGMIVVVAPDRADRALGALVGAGVDAFTVGLVEPGPRGVEFVGAPFWPTESAGVAS